MISYDICLSLSDLFHSLGCSLGPSVLLQMASFHSFFLFSFFHFILFYGGAVFHCIYTPQFLSAFIYRWTQVVSMSWLLWIVLPWTLGCMYLFKLWVLLNTCLGVGLTKKYLGFPQMVCVCCVQSCLTLCDPLDCSPPGFSVHGDSPGKYTGAGCRVFLQRIFPT